MRISLAIVVAAAVVVSLCIASSQFEEVGNADHPHADSAADVDVTPKKAGCGCGLPTREGSDLTDRKTSAEDSSGEGSNSPPSLRDGEVDRSAKEEDGNHTDVPNGKDNEDAEEDGKVETEEDVGDTNPYNDIVDVQKEEEEEGVELTEPVIEGHAEDKERLLVADILAEIDESYDLAAQTRTNEMVYIRAASFQMGNDHFDKSTAMDGESPARQVKLTAYYLDRHATSNSEFARFVRDARYVTEVMCYMYYVTPRGISKDMSLVICQRSLCTLYASIYIRICICYTCKNNTCSDRCRIIHRG